MYQGMSAWVVKNQALTPGDYHADEQGTNSLNTSYGWQTKIEERISINAYAPAFWGKNSLNAII